MPAFEKVGQTADDVLALIANGPTCGYADKVEGCEDRSPDVRFAQRPPNDC